MKRELSITYQFETEEEMASFEKAVTEWKTARTAKAELERKEREALTLRLERAIVAAQCGNCPEHGKCGGPDSFRSRPYCDRGEMALKLEHRQARHRPFIENAEIVKRYLGENKPTPTAIPKAGETCLKCGRALREDKQGGCWFCPECGASFTVQHVGSTVPVPPPLQATEHDGPR